ncbi:MAG: hypothetical protein LBC93_05315, partial [Synergistaceae bacterium]|nr:hypothetical protein [Synergistaceae bacterium]
MNGYEKSRILMEIKARIAETMPLNPILNGWNSYSQCDEDGIIRECLTRIRNSGCEMSQTFLELGCGNGLENNTAQLLIDNFTGCWVDGSRENIKFIEENLGGGGIFPSLLVQESFLTLDNIEEIIKNCTNFLGTEETDFLSLDIDGNDLALLPKILSYVTPKLLCVEYNAKFPPSTVVEMTYLESHAWSGDDYFGASLQAYVNCLNDYQLVCCNMSGCNAFFAHKNYAGVFAGYNVRDLYQPARYWLAAGAEGHPSSLKWIRQAVNKNR